MNLSIDTLLHEIVSKSLLLVSKSSQGFLNQLVLKNGYLSTCKCYHLSCSCDQSLPAVVKINYEVWYKMPLNASEQSWQMRSSCFGEQRHCVICTRCHVSFGGGSVVPSVGSTSFEKVGGFASLLDGTHGCVARIF